jgi:hypothetical protein
MAAIVGRVGAVETEGMELERVQARLDEGALEHSDEIVA